MTEVDRGDIWEAGAQYDRFMGRWSGLVATTFLSGLGAPPDGRWLDVGCGTGVLTRAILERTAPAEVVGIDASDGFIAEARARTARGARFIVGDAQMVPFGDAAFDVVVSGLVLNFVPDPVRAVAEMLRVARPGGTVAVYVWDYAAGMGMLRSFWDGAIAIDPAARVLDEGARFPICAPDPLRALFSSAGARRADVSAVEVATTFRDVDDYWSPFLGGQGPAGSYVAALDATRRDALRDRVLGALPTAADGSIPLVAKAWVVRAGR